MLKKCQKCKEEKDTYAFYKNKVEKDGLQRVCKDCQKARHVENREEDLAYSRQYYQDHKEECDANNKAWGLLNKGKMTQYYVDYDEKRRGTPRRRLQQKLSMRVRRATDINVKLSDRLRARLYQAIIKEFKAGSAVSDLGCSVAKLKAHLESMFQPSMSWDNWGRGKGNWNIDHIMPLDAFDLSDRQHFLLANHYLNLQPLWFEENNAKGNKLCHSLLMAS